MKYQLLILLLFPYYLHAQLFISQGAIMEMSNGAELSIVEMNLENNGDFNAGDGKVIFKEINSASDIEIMGTQTPTFKDVDFDLQNRKVSLMRDIEINGNIDFQSGCVNLNNYNCHLGTNAMLNNENNGNSFISTGSGQIIQSVNLNAPSNVNVGNLGAVITSSENLGLVTIRRGHNAQTIGTNQSIQRYYEIEPTNNQNLNATLRFYYLDNELNGIPENELNLWRQSNNNWQNMGYTTQNLTQNYLVLTGIDHFSTWTAIGNTSILPVELSFFEVEKQGEEAVLLTWETLSELNNEGFEVQRAIENESPHLVWEALDFVWGKGTIAESQRYSYLDNQPHQGLNYYRIKQVDYNGTATFSNIKTIFFEDKKAISIGHIFPNPAWIDTPIQLPITTMAATEFEIQIIDSWGKQVYHTSTETASGNNNLLIDITQIPVGHYAVLITAKEQNWVRKFIRH